MRTFILFYVVFGMVVQTRLPDPYVARIVARQPCACAAAYIARATRRARSRADTLARPVCSVQCAVRSTVIKCALANKY